MTKQGDRKKNAVEKKSYERVLYIRKEEKVRNMEYSDQMKLT